MNQLLLPEPDIDTLMDRVINAAVCWVKKTGNVCRLDRYTDTGGHISNIITNNKRGNSQRWDTKTNVFWCDTSCSGSIPDITINLSAGVHMLAGIIDLLED